MSVHESGNPVTPRIRQLTFDRTDARDASLAWLRDNGIDVHPGRADGNPAFNRYTEDQIIEEAQGFDAVLGASTAPFTRRVIEALPRLRFISKIGVGVDSIDIAAATDHGIIVTNTPESAGVTAVAEHAIALMLALLKRVTVLTPALMRDGKWRDSEFSGTMEGSTVGIIGFGRIGRAVAQRLAGWNVRILVSDPHARPSETDVTWTDLPDLLAKSDIVTLHCAPTADNRHMINRATLALMKPGAILVNTARGSLIDTPALVERLKSGALAGVALDVFEPEPPEPRDELLTQKNVVVTAHMAARSLEVFLDRRRRAARNLLAMVKGEPCPDIVNPEVLAKRAGA